MFARKQPEQKVSTPSSQRRAEDGILKDQMNQCVETGRNAVSSAAAAVERPVKDAVESAKQRVREYTDAGRETLHATREKAQVLADEGKQRVEGIIDAAAAYVGRGSHAEDNDANSPSYPAKVRSAADQCVEMGKKVITDAKTSAGAYQAAAVEAVQNKLNQGRQQVESYTASAKDRVEPLVDSAKGFVSNSKKRFNEAKPYVHSIATRGKEAVAKRDPNLLLAVFAQMVAGLFSVVNVFCVYAYSLQFVKETTDRVYNSSLLQKTFDYLKGGKVARVVEHIPFVGTRIMAATTAFVDDVKKNMEQINKKE